jgi:hypothetical protein
MFKRLAIISKIETELSATFVQAKENENIKNISNKIKTIIYFNFLNIRLSFIYKF